MRRFSSPAVLIGILSLASACKTNSGSPNSTEAGSDMPGASVAQGEQGAAGPGAQDAFALINTTAVSHPRNTNVLDVLPTDGASGAFNPATGNMLVTLPGGAIYRSRGGFASGAFGSGTATDLVVYMTSNSATAPTRVDVYSPDGDVETYLQNSVSKYFVSKNTRDWIRFVSTSKTFERVDAEGYVTTFGLVGTKHRPLKSSRYGIT
ncbi:hypothetical protein E3A20_29650, partial [Planctomyces bekefii]